MSDLVFRAFFYVETKGDESVNILHLKYAVSIADNGSINKAAEEIHVAQPNLSRVIKELEADLGITIFQRSAHGMILTPEGEEFVGRARKILEQVDDMEHMYKSGQPACQRFSISAPRASYISDAFAHFSRSLSKDDAEVFYQETNVLKAVRNILEVGYNLGILRYASKHEKYFREMLEDKDLTGDLIMEFTYCLIMHEDSPLAKMETIRMKDLAGYIQIAHADPYVPSMPLSVVKNEELPDIPRRIYVFERGSQMDLLSENPETFMWVSPIPERLLKNLHLVQRRCVDNQKLYRDVLIRRKNYHLTELDKQFITELTISKRNCMMAENA